MTQALQRRRDRKGPNVLSSINTWIALTAHKLPRCAAKPNRKANNTESMMVNDVNRLAFDYGRVQAQRP